MKLEIRMFNTQLSFVYRNSICKLNYQQQFSSAFFLWCPKHFFLSACLKKKIRSMKCAHFTFGIPKKSNGFYYWPREWMSERENKMDSQAKPNHLNIWNSSSNIHVVSILCQRLFNASNKDSQAKQNAK